MEVDVDRLLEGADDGPRFELGEHNQQPEEDIVHRYHHRERVQRVKDPDDPAHDQQEA